MQNVYKESMKMIINKFGSELYEKLKLSPGFDIEKQVVKQLDGEIEKCELPEKIYARITPIDNNTRFKISYANQLEFDSYMRFSIAHELGHLFLHMVQKDEQGKRMYVGDYARQFESMNSSLVEWEAEEFAAAFLMPENIFKEKIEEVEMDEKVEDKFQWLADMFKVPYKSVIIRGKSLEIW